MSNIILPEIVAIGVYNSNIAVKNLKITLNRKTTMFEIELPLEKGGISYIDSEESPIVPDIVICSKPGQVRHSMLPYKCYYVHMIIEDGELEDKLMCLPTFISTKKSELYKQIFIDLCNYNNTAFDRDEIIIQSLILKLIYTMYRDTENISPNNSKNIYNEVIKNATTYIKKNLTENLNLEQISSIVSLSPVHFHNCFKKSTGKTLRNYVEEQRIKKAVNLLVTTDYSLSEIAMECGFSSQSYFNYVFKRRMKVTPREYAKEINNRYNI